MSILLHTRRQAHSWATGGEHTCMVFDIERQETRPVHRMSQSALARWLTRAFQTTGTEAACWTEHRSSTAGSLCVTETSCKVLQGDSLRNNTTRLLTSNVAKGRGFERRTSKANKQTFWGTNTCSTISYLAQTVPSHLTLPHAQVCCFSFEDTQLF